MKLFLHEGQSMNLAFWRKSPPPAPVPSPMVEVARTIPDPDWPDVLSVVLADYPTEHPSLRDLENAYEESGIVYSCIQEIVQAVSTADIAGSVGARTLLEHPNSVQDRNQLIGQFLAGYLSTGVGYIVKLPQRSRAVQELHCLRASAMSLQYGSFMQPYQRMYYDDSYNHYDLIPDDLIMRLNPSAKSALEPVSPMSANWDSVLLDIAMQRYQRLVLKKLPAMVNVIETDSDAMAGKGQREQLRRSVSKITGGDSLILPRGSHAVSPGLLRDIGLEKVAWQCETRLSAAYNVPAICCGFQVGIKTATYSNYGEARASLRDETVAPLLVMLSEMFSRGLGQTVEFTLPEVKVAPNQAVQQMQTDQQNAGIGGSDANSG